MFTPSELSSKMLKKYSYKKDKKFRYKQNKLNKIIHTCIRLRQYLKIKNKNDKPIKSIFSYQEIFRAQTKFLAPLTRSNLKEALEIQSNWIQQADNGNWIANKITDMLTQRLTEKILSAWPSLLINTCAISSISFTLFSIIMASIDLWQYGITTARILGMLSSLMALASQVAFAVGVIKLGSQIYDIIGDLFKNLTESSSINDFMSSTLTPEQQHIVMTSMFDSTIPYEPLPVPHPTMKTKLTKDEITELSNINSTMTRYEDLRQLISMNTNVDINLLMCQEDDKLLEWFATIYGTTFKFLDLDKQDNLKVQAEFPLHHINIVKSNDKYIINPGTTKQGTPSLETFISIAVGFTALAISICGMSEIGWATSMAKGILNASKIKKVIKDEVKDAREIVETIAEEVFNYKMSPFSKLKEQIISNSDKLTEFLNHPHSYYAANPVEYYKFKQLCITTKQLLTTCKSPGSQIPQYLSSAFTILMAQLTRAEQYFTELSRASIEGKRRQETIPVMVVGRYGAGKTHFLTQFVIPSIIKHFGWADRLYSLNFGGQEYFPPYAGQEVCLYDEFLDVKEDDPLIPHINGICSGAAYNMPGAELWTKVQPCLFKIMFLAANVHYVSLRNKISPEVEMAFYSRFKRYEIINKNIPTTNDYDRNNIPRTPDYSEFEIRRYLKPATQNSAICALQPTKPNSDTLNTPDPYVIITKEQFLEDCINSVTQFQDIFNNTIVLPPIGNVVPPAPPITIPEKQVIFKDPEIPEASVSSHNTQVDLLTKAVEQKGNTSQELFITSIDDIIRQQMGDLDLLDEVKFDPKGDLVKIVKELQAIDWHTAEVDITQDIYELIEYLISKAGKRALQVSGLNKADLEKLKVTFDQVFPQEDPPQQGEDKKVDHFVCLLKGDTDSGKSTAARKLSVKLAKIFKMKVFDVSVETLKEVALQITTPSIVVLHDKMSNEQDYINFYDSLPKPSIIINTNNVRISTERGKVSYQTTDCNDNELGYLSYYTKKIINKLQQANFYWRKVSVIQPHSCAIPEPGFARRLGVSGYISHAGQIHFRSEETTSYYHCLPYSRFVCPNNNKEIGEVALLEEIVQKYLQIYNKSAGIQFKCVEDIPEDTADVILRFPDVETLKKSVNDPVEVLKIFSKSTKDPQTRPFIGISPRVYNSSFTFTADMFYIAELESIESVKQMAERAYALLIKGNTQLTCLLDVGSEFRAYCSNGIISFKIGNEHQKKYKIYNHTIQKLNVNGTTKHYITINAFQEEKNNQIAVLDMDLVAAAIIKGMQTLPIDQQKLEVYEYIMLQSDKLKETPDLKPYFEKYQLRQIFVSEVVDSTPVFYSLWSMFTKSTVYKVVLVLCAVVVAIVGLFAILGIGKLLYKLFFSKKQGKDSIVYVNGVKATIKPKLNGTVVDFKIESEEEIDNDVEDLICNIHSTEYPNYAMGSIEYTIQQSNSNSYDGSKGRIGKKGKGIPTKTMRRIQQQQPKQSIRNSSAIAIQTKIYDNQVWIKGTRSDCYGLRWKGLEVLSPAHIWNSIGEVGYINVPFKGNHMLCSALVYWLDHVNDIAVLRINNKECPMASDLTKYFSSESHFETIKEGAILSRAVSLDKRPYQFFKSPQTLIQGNVLPYIRRDNTVNEGTKRHVAFYRVGLELVNTAPGDCGSPYISLDNHVGHEILLGFHTNIQRDGRSTYGCYISKEYLACIKPMQLNGTTQAGVNIATQQDAIEFDEHVKLYIDNPNKFETGVKYGITPFYKEWFDNLEEKERQEDEVWYDALENPEANVTLIGYDPKHKPSHLGKVSHVPTPWSEDLEKQLPITKWHSLFKPSQHSNPESLKKLGKKPSLLAEQISYYNDKCELTPRALTLLENAYESCLADYRSKYPTKLRILTDLETINGTFFSTRDPLYGCLEAIDLDSSAGDYPMRRHGLTTKKTLFRKIDIRNPTGRDIYTWNTTHAAMDVMESVNNHQLYAEEGYRLLVPMKDALKFELVEKKDKARLFTVLSLEETMLGRKFTGALQAVIMKEHSIAHTQVGINPLPGFQTLYQRLHTVSKYGEAGDYKRWDKHMQAELILAAFKLFAQLYKDSLDDTLHKIIDNVFLVMADTTINSLSIADGYVYMKHRGVPSGCPTTAILNSCINDIMQYMCLEYLCQEHNNLLTDIKHLSNTEQETKLLEVYGKEWHNYLGKIKQPIQYNLNWVKTTMDWATYGDDFVSAINDLYLWLINFKSRQNFYSNVMGVLYDDPTKDGKSYLYKELYQLMFLSRVFRQEAGLTFAALKKSSIESLLHYARTNSIEQYKGNIKDCQDEAILWGKEYYEFIQDKIRFIIGWLEEHGVHLEVTLVPYSQQLNWAIDTIRYTKAVRILPEEPEQKGNIDNVKPDYIVPSAKSICETPSIQQGITMQREELLQKTHRVMQTINFRTAKCLTAYHPYPAYVEQYNTHDAVSVVFNGKEYINSLTVSGKVQSDIMTLIMPSIANLGLTLGRITIIHRAINKELKPAYQVLFYYKETKKVIDSLAASLSTINIKKTVNSTQASGTETRSKVQGGMNMNPDGEVTQNLNHGHKVPKSDLSRVLWHQDIKSVAHTPMETPDSPLSIAINTPAHTVIFKRTLNDISKMPPGMKAWASMHTYSNASRIISMKFISAATLINELILGISPVSKTTYTIQELQLIHWTALNPQDVTATVSLELADVAWHDFPNAEVNRYQFDPTDTGTDSSPVHIPTLVLLTRVGIQNSYANPDVTVQIAIQEHFGPGEFLIDQDKLNNMLPSDPSAFRQVGTTKLSQWLNIDAGMPFYITCDGGNNVKVDPIKYNEQLINKTLYSSQYEFLMMAFRETGSLSVKINLAKTLNKTIPIFVKNKITTIHHSYVPFNDFMQTEEPNVVSDFKEYLRTHLVNQGKLTTYYETPFNPVFMLSVINLNGKGDYQASIQYNYSSCTIDPTKPLTNSFNNIIDIVSVDLKNALNCTDYTISLVPTNLITLNGRYFRWNSSEPQFESAVNTELALAGLSLRTTGPTENNLENVKTIQYAAILECYGNGNTFRQLLVIYDNYSSSNASTGSSTFYSHPTISIETRSVTGDHFKSSVIQMTGTVTTEMSLTSDIEILSQVITEVVRSADGVIDTNFSHISFPPMIPKTITPELAQTRTPVEFNSEIFVTAFKRKLVTEGIPFNDPNKVIIFNISTLINTGISIVVVYNPYYDAFFINNNPQSDSDYYKTFRKLTYEDVIISQLRTVDRYSAAVPLTNTSQWLNRVTSNETLVFTGNILTDPRNVQKTGKIKLKYIRKEANSSQAAMAGLATASIVSGIFSDIFGYLSKMQLMDHAMELQLKAMQAQYENQAKLMDQEYQYKIIMLEKQIAAAITQQNTAIDQQNNLRLNLSGLQSGLSNRTSGLGDKPKTPSTSEVQTNSDNNLNELLEEDSLPYIPPNQNSDSNFLVGNVTSPTIAKNTNVNIAPPVEEELEPHPINTQSGSYQNDKLNDYQKNLMNPSTSKTQRIFNTNKIQPITFLKGETLQPTISKEVAVEKPTTSGNLSQNDGLFHGTFVVNRSSKGVYKDVPTNLSLPRNHKTIYL